MFRWTNRLYLIKETCNYILINFIASVEEKAICILNTNMAYIIIREQFAEILSGIKKLHSFHSHDTTIMAALQNTQENQHN
jgi:hypothetical protein